MSSTDDDHDAEAPDAPDAGAPAGSLPVEPADNGEPVLDPDADSDDSERARAGASRLERHNRGRPGDRASG